MSTNVSSDPGLPAARPVARLGRSRVALVLALLLGLQPVTTDLYLPALAQLTTALGASVAAAQLTMSALLLSFGLGQLVWGPVADRFGRRPVLLLGLLLYTLAGAGAALAPAIEWLIAWRLLQGLGLAASIVCGRALLRDLYNPHEGAQVMAWAMTGLGLIAIASPALGGLITTSAGWRAALAAVAATGLAVLAWVAATLPETVPQRRPDATRPAVLLAAWRQVITHPVFVAWALLTAASFAGLFVMLASSSFVYIGVLGLSPTVCGLLVASASLAYIGGTFLCRRWVPRLGTVGTVLRGTVFTFSGGLLMVLPEALGLWSLHSAWALALPMALYMVGHGVIQPCSQSGAVGPFPQQAGAAAALSGFLLALVAMGASLWLGQVLDGRSVRPMAYGVAGAALLATGLAWTLVRRLPAQR